MGQTFKSIGQQQRKFIAKQHMFFVATAPLAPDSRVNVSPKGHCAQTFSILGDNRVAFLDLTGSGVETLAHVKENGRITFMFCSFDESPCILRLWGRAIVHERGTPEFEHLMAAAFPCSSSSSSGGGSSGSSSGGSSSSSGLAAASGASAAALQGSTAAADADAGAELISPHPGFAAGARSIIVADIFEVATACGYAVPHMEYKADRDSLLAWSSSKGPAGIEEYRQAKNTRSLDALPGLGAADRYSAGSSSSSSSKAVAGRVQCGSGCLAGLLRGEAVGWLGLGVTVGVVLGVSFSRRW